MLKSYENVYKSEFFYPDQDIQPNSGTQEFEVGIVYCMSWECRIGNIKHFIGPQSEYWMGNFDPDGLENPLHLVVFKPPEPYKNPVSQIDDWLKACFEVFSKDKLLGRDTNYAKGAQFPV
jgi:hypothetical protein